MWLHSPEKQGGRRKRATALVLVPSSLPTVAYTHSVPYHCLSSNTHILALSQRKADLPAADINSMQPSWSPPPSNKAGPTGGKHCCSPSRKESCFGQEQLDFLNTQKGSWVSRLKHPFPQDLSCSCDFMWCLGVQRRGLQGQGQRQGGSVWIDTDPTLIRPSPAPGR